MRCKELLDVRELPPGGFFSATDEFVDLVVFQRAIACHVRLDQNVHRTHTALNDLAFHNFHGTHQDANNVRWASLSFLLAAMKAVFQARDDIGGNDDIRAPVGE